MNLYIENFIQETNNFEIDWLNNYETLKEKDPNHSFLRSMVKNSESLRYIADTYFDRHEAPGFQVFLSLKTRMNLVEEIAQGKPISPILGLTEDLIFRKIFEIYKQNKNLTD